MTLSVIIVNYNVKRLLEQCLASVAIAAKAMSVEVFIVDNASTDGSVEFLQRKFPFYTFISNKENVGFARANNQALRSCSGEQILFLNPDTILPPDCFENCITFLKAHPEAGAVGVKMIDGQGNFLKESKRGLPTPVASLWKLTGISRLFPRSRFFSAYYAGHLDPRKIQQVEVLSGAFMMVRHSVLKITGGFDERFFMYAEDIDLSYRILKAGFRNYYLPSVEIIHLKGSSTQKDVRYVKQFYTAMSQYVRKHYGNGMFAALLDAGIFLRGTASAIHRLLFSGKKKVT